MQQQLMQRQNAGKSDAIDFVEKKTEEKNFFDRTVKDILQRPCPLCQVLLEEPNGATTILHCQHTMHSGCFENLKKQYKNCPECHQPLEIVSESNEEETPCCIRSINHGLKAITTSIEYNTYLFTYFLNDFFDPYVTWQDISEKIYATSSHCHDDHVTF